MRVIVLEPSAVEYDRTHNLNSIVGFTRLFEENKISVVWVTNRRCRVNYDNIPNYPLFSYTIYDDIRSEQKDEVFRIKS